MSNPFDKRITDAINRYFVQKILQKYEKKRKAQNFEQKDEFKLAIILKILSL
ncbi:hypothetical protein AGMMS4956_02260 [Bacteroidia bacterium]|nr:hypothetical protein AGMMS4956_02260 [Bacteroidia bacterium]